MATFYEFFNEQKYADAVKNVSVASSKCLPQNSPPLAPLRVQCGDSLSVFCAKGFLLSYFLLL